MGDLFVKVFPSDLLNNEIYYKISNIYNVFHQQTEDKELLKELGKNGDGRPSEIQQLLDEVG